MQLFLKFLLLAGHRSYEELNKDSMMITDSDEEYDSADSLGVPSKRMRKS
jgi:hypothetical protein